MAKDPIQPERCAKLLAALAAPERLKIVRFLAGGKRTVTEITEMLRVPAVKVCDVPAAKVAELAEEYAKAKPAAVFRRSRRRCR